MAYTWNTDRTGGVGITSKITQKGIDLFPLMYANDLDWADVEIESGITLKKTDDLLDYIKGEFGNLGTRIDNVSSSNAGYEVRCDVSICYEGDQLSEVPVEIYKDGVKVANVGDSDDSDSICLKRPYTMPTGGADIITFNTVHQYLNGIVSVPGTYMFEFVKGLNTANEIVVASFSLTVLMKAYKSATVVAYKTSSTLPSKPVGASYNFTNKQLIVGSDGWQNSASGLSNPIWFCSGYVNESDNTSIVWNDPCIYLTSEIVNTENEYRVKEVAVYKACHGAYTDGTN